MSGVLQFDPASHTYTREGAVVRSVTEILEDVGIIDYHQIPNDTRQMALHRGSMVHLATQLYDEHDLIESSVDPAITPYLSAWKRFLSETGFIIETDQIETRLYNPTWNYAGTRDRRGRLQGLPMVLDIKTNNAPAWVRMQLAAYCECEKFPTLTRRMAVELHADETYRAIPISVSQHAADFNDFCCALRTYHLKRESNPSLGRRKAA